MLTEPVMIVSPEGEVRHVNPAFMTTFQTTYAEVVGHLLWDLGDAWRDTPLKDVLLHQAYIGDTNPIPNGIEMRYQAPGDTRARHLTLNALPVDIGLSCLNAPNLLVTVRDDTELRACQEELAHLREEAKVALWNRDRLLRDVLSAATEGKLILCQSEKDLPLLGTPRGEPVPLALSTLRQMRMQVRQQCAEVQMPLTRIDDFENAVGEAAMNAVIHGEAGTGQVRVREGDTPVVQTWIRDYGKGISILDLPRAALEKGYSSSGTMGQGFKIILQTSDKVYLLTGDQGTTLVLEQAKEAPVPDWLLNIGERAF